MATPEELLQEKQRQELHPHVVRTELQNMCEQLLARVKEMPEDFMHSTRVLPPLVIKQIIMTPTLSADGAALLPAERKFELALREVK